MATKKSKHIDEIKDAIAKNLLEKQISYAYLKNQLENETDEDRKKQVQLAVDKAETDVSHVTKLHEFVTDNY